MEIVEIIPPYLYSVKYDDEHLDEYHRVFRDWHEVGYLAEFFRLNADYLKQPFWKDISISSPRKLIMVKHQTSSHISILWMVSIYMSGD